MNSDNRPNVVVIVTHDLGDWLGCYGHRVNSPNLDRLAAEGARFGNHFCPSSLCSPARGSLITGLYPHTNGLMGLCNLGWNLPDWNQTDAQRFEAAGYRTALVGFQHEKQAHADLGFQQDFGGRFLASSNYATDYVGECASELLGAFASAQESGKDRRPFYLRMGTYSVHRTIDPVSGSYGYEPMVGRGLDESDVEVLPVWKDTPGLRYDLSGFTGEVANMDRGVGLVLDALDRYGLTENTLVVFTTDHGIDFPRGKGTVYDLGTRTALLMRWPNRIAPGTTVSSLSSHVDILPSLLEACNIKPLPSCHGASLIPLLDGRSDSVNDCVFASESSFPGNLARSIRTDRYRLIHNISQGKRSFAALCTGGRTEIDTGDFYFEDRVEYEFYDLEQDPHEQENLSGQEAVRTLEADLRARLRHWQEETGDPILTGHIERPNEERELFSRAIRRPEDNHTNTLWRD